MSILCPPQIMKNGFFPPSPATLRKTVLSLLPGIALTLPAQAAPPELKTQGNQVVVKATGVPVRLAGVNIPSLEWGNGENLMASLEAAIHSWQVNIIRLPVSQSRWLAGGAYLDTVDDFIAQASEANVYVILDLHGYGHPDSGSLTFWTSAANRYKNNPAVLFGLLNEPHGTGWEIWRNGDTSHPGLQALLDAVRATGANNIVLAGGGDWGFDLSGILNGYALTDPTGNGIVYDSHVYPWKTYIQSKVGTVAQTYPVLLGELGHPGGTSYNGMSFEHHSTWVPKIMDWVNSHNLHWTGWSFHPSASPCLISDFNYTPTAYWGGAALAHLLSYRNPSADRVVGGTVIGTPGTRTQPNSGVITDYISGAVVAFNEGHSTYFDAATASGGWTGLDLGVARRITRLDYMPRQGYGSRMTGGVFQGANNPNFSGATTLFTVPSAPVDTGSVYTRATVYSTGTFRYVRYMGPPGSYCNVASILFYTGDGTGSGSGGTDVIVDNADATGVVWSGTWVSSTGSGGYYGLNYRHDNNTGKGTKSVRFTPHLSLGGNYEVFGRWAAHANRASNVPFDIANAGGTDFFQTSQQVNGGQWFSLGVFPFQAGTTGSVVIGTEGTNGFVVADALRFVRLAEVVVDNSDLTGVTLTGSWSVSSSPGFHGVNSLHDGNTGKGSKSVRFTPTLTETRNYEVFAWWTSHSNRATEVPIDIVFAGGTATIPVNQQEEGGQWVSLGIYPFAAGTSGSVLVRNAGTSGYVVADAVRFVPR
jgi:hypothetical protein